MPSTNDVSRSTAGPSLPGWGVNTHTMSSTTDADAWSGPDRSEPPIGWPPTNLGASVGADRSRTDAITSALMLPTSVTTADGAEERHAATRPGMAGIGAHTTTTTASR